MTEANKEQAEYWGASEPGQKWVTFQERFDASLHPVLDLVLDRAGLIPGDRVLDIGCGTGASLLACGERVGPDGSVFGADISPPFVELARKRVAEAGLSNVEVQIADAQSAPFEPASRTKMISRFGVMFFSDTTAAFANIAKALTPGGTITFAAWDIAPNNPWFSTPARIASERLGKMPPADPHAPGPMAFADRARVVALLEAAGLKGISVDTVDLFLTPSGGASGAANLSTWAGPAARVISHFEAGPEDAAAIEADVHAAFADYDTPQGMRVPASIHLFQARAA